MKQPLRYLTLLLIWLGAIALAAAPLPARATPPTSPAVRELCNTTNIAGVESRPTAPTVFSISQPHVITYIMDYHYFNNGARPGTIALRHSDGTRYGPWRATGRTGQGGVLNAVWEVTPNVEIKAGTYTVVDSDSGTWSQNAESGHRGHTLVKGYAATGEDALPFQARVGREPAPPPSPAGSRTTRTGTLTTGAAIDVATRSAAAGGALALDVQTPGHPLDGFRLAVPAGSYRDARTFRVSCAPITGMTFAEVRPASPLITIDNGGGYSRELMRVRIPVAVAADEFAMGFYYDAGSGQLEGLPLLAADAASVTVATRHFSSIFASAVKLAVLDHLIVTGKIDSGFRPGVDDWQFPNEGSYLEPGGHCAGQSLSALWYYVNRPDGPAVTLHDRYDRNGLRPGTPDFWLDDNRSYRLASVVQNAIDWGSWQNQLMTAAAGVSDPLTLRAFAYAMLVTGEPQEAGIFSDTGGHDMIVYRIAENTLYIADPNYPGNNDRRIVYDPARGRFQPYHSAANAREIEAGYDTVYDTIQYAAKSATLDWGVIAAQWRKMKEGTVGNGLFPAYRFAWRDGAGREYDLPDSSTVTQRQLTILPRLANNLRGRAFIFQRAVLKSPGPVVLNPGRNVFGVLVLGQRGKEWTYVDFVPLTIFYSGLTLEPPRLEGEMNREYTFTAKLPGAPAGTRYEWTANGLPQNGSVTEISKFLFTVPGNFVIGVTAFDTGHQNLGSCTAPVVIKPDPPATGNLARLHATRGLRQLAFSGGEHLSLRSPSGEERREGGNFSATHYLLNNDLIPVTWSGTRFTASGRWSAGEGNEMSYTLDASGTVSPDGERLLGVEWTFKRFSGGRLTMEESVAITNFPGGPFGGHTSLAAEITPAQAQACCRVIKSWTSGANTDSYVSSDWARGRKPRLNIDFR